MPWLSFSDPFRRCCGLREGKRGSNYDAWLARERLNQLKRLETRLADLTQENASLAAQLGQAVNVMDSYHNFDIAALQAASSIPDDRSDSVSASRRVNEMASQASRGRSGSLAPRSRADSLASRNQSLGGKMMRTKADSLPAAHLVLPTPTPAIPERLLRIGVPALSPAAGSAPSPRPQASVLNLADIPSARELDDLLARNHPNRRPRRQPTVPVAATDTLSRAASAVLPPVSSLVHLVNAAPTQDDEQDHPRASLDTQPRSSASSFTFSPSGRLQGTLPPVHEEADTLAETARPGIMVERSQPSPQVAPVPVQDKAMLATQARGQIYSSHYSAATSPFAQAAARMPGPDGSSPLRARPKAGGR